MTEQTDVKTWLETYVNSAEWRDSLRKAVNDVENPAQKAKLLLDLLDYVMPKLKTVDPPTGNEGQPVSITYVQDDGKRNDSSPSAVPKSVPDKPE